MNPHPTPNHHHILTPTLLYCPTPKALSTNIKTLILNPQQTTPTHQTHTLPHQNTTHLTTKQLQNIHHTHHTILITRNPTTRLLSTYLNKYTHNKPPNWPPWNLPNRPNTPQNPITFQEFIEHITQQQPQDTNEHWTPIWYLATPHITYTTTIKQEEIQTHQHHLEQIIGKGPLPTPQQLQYPRQHAEQQTTKYYTKKLHQLVHDHYQQDYTQYNYPLP